MTPSHTKTASAVATPTTSSVATSSVVTPVTSSPTTPTAPPTASSTVVLNTSPPVLTLPSIPAGYIPVTARATGGIFPRATQVAAAADVVTELSATATYTEQLGPAAPTVGPFLSLFTIAVGWTLNRVGLESYLNYTKAQEGLAWRAVAPELEQLKAVFDVTVARNPELTKQFPALTRFLGATVAISKKAAASRKRNAAAARAATTAAPSATNPGTPTPATPVAATANGGAAH